jgi:hypothetical protein
MACQALVSRAASISFKPNRSIHRTVLFFALLLALIATGTTPAQASGELKFTPNAANFGRVPVGRTHTLTVTIANGGNATVVLSGDTVSGSGYSVTGIHVPMTLSPGATATFEVGFTPRIVGTSTGTLKLISNAANGTAALALTGSGFSRSAGYVTATPLIAQFGDVPVGTKNTQSVQLKNTGTRAVSISGATATGGGFSVSGIAAPYWLGAGASVELTIVFQPSRAGSASGAVTIGSTASDSSLSIAVSGTGIATTRLLGVSPGSLAFGNITLGWSTTRVLKLTNTGNSSLTISGDTVSGAGVSATGMSGSTTLAPGQSATLTAGFAPTVASSMTGAITITSNATNAPSVTVPVTGTGVSAVSHSVALTWQPSSSSGVSGYYVYRATASGGPYARVDSSAVGGTSYTDTGVSAGVTYYYAVTTLGTDGIESGYSNQVKAVVP